jgi:hypothetical protein
VAWITSHVFSGSVVAVVVGEVVVVAEVVVEVVLTLDVVGLSSACSDVGGLSALASPEPQSQKAAAPARAPPTRIEKNRTVRVTPSWRLGKRPQLSAPRPT